MKVKATTNFAGEICMATGEIRDVPESVAAPLLKCGYLEAAEPSAEMYPDAMTKDELLKKAESMGVEVKSSWTKTEIADAINAATEG